MIFPDNSVAKESACNAGDPVGFLSREDPLEKGIGYPLQYSGLERSMDCPLACVGSQPCLAPVAGGPGRRVTEWCLVS